MYILLSLVPFLCIGYWIFSMNRRTNISFDVRYGRKCYSCKEDVPEDIWFDSWVVSGSHKHDGLSEKLHLCKSCMRDEKIGYLHNKFNINSIKRFVLSKKSQNLSIFFMVLMCICTVLDIVLVIYGIDSKGDHNTRIFSILNSVFSVCFWTLFLFRDRLTTIKKPSKK